MTDNRRSQPSENRKNKTDPNLVHNIHHIPDRLRLVDLDKTWVASRSEVHVRLRETGLDLYLVSSDAVPPVYKLLDYGRFRYDQQKKKREQQKRLREQNRSIKEFKFKPQTGDHDIEVKIHHIRESLADHDIKICMDLKRNAFVLTNRWSISIHQVVAEEGFVLNKVLAGLEGYIQTTKLTITDNQIFAILKRNEEDGEIPN